MEMEFSSEVQAFADKAKQALLGLESATPHEIWRTAKEQGWLTRDTLLAGSLFESLALARALGQAGVEARPLIDEIAWRSATGSSASPEGSVHYVGTERALVPDPRVYVGPGVIYIADHANGSVSISSVAGSSGTLQIGEWERSNDPAVASNLYWLHRLLLSAHSAAAGRVAVEVATEYSKERHQFGQPIGVYQGVQHTLVKAFTDITSLELLIDRATQLLAQNGPDTPGTRGLLEIVSIRAQRVAWNTAIASHDVLGGIGFMRSHPLTVFSELLIRDHALLAEQPSNWEAAVDLIGEVDWLSTEGLAQA
jgi:hypothetical protein